MLEDLHAAGADATFRRAYRRYLKPDLLYLDEFGYDPFTPAQTSQLFRIVGARHRNASIILTANTGFSRWKTLFPSEAIAVATVDRLVDDATILRFTGTSVRSSARRSMSKHSQLRLLTTQCYVADLQAADVTPTSQRNSTGKAQDSFCLRHSQQ
jgi:DNA replication protein DnaC